MFIADEKHKNALIEKLQANSSCQSLFNNSVMGNLIEQVTEDTYICLKKDLTTEFDLSTYLYGWMLLSSINPSYRYFLDKIVKLLKAEEDLYYNTFIQSASTPEIINSIISHKQENINTVCELWKCLSLKPGRGFSESYADERLYLKTLNTQ